MPAVKAEASAGATETQLFKKYRQLWRDPDVAAILKRGDVDQLMRQIRLAEDWRALKGKIDVLRSEAGAR